MKEIENTKGESTEVVEAVEIVKDASGRVENPFAVGRAQSVEMSAPAHVEGQYGVQAAREMAEVQGMVVMAKKFPRDKIRATERILNDCTRPKLAENALYTYSRGGTEISGPSIRLAESIAQNWGNIDFGIKELEQSKGVSKVMAFAWDLETNARQTKIFEVPHVRTTKKGSYRLEDPRDIYELVANNGARRLRACILGIIPGDVIDAAVEQCDRTLRTTADISPDNVQKMVSLFEKMGVSKAQIEKRIQRRIDAIQPAQMVALRKIYKSISDGMAAASDFFEVEETSANSSGEKSQKGGVGALKSKIAGGKGGEE